MQIKPEKKPWIIWDGSTKTSADQIVLNEQTSIEFEAIVDFGTAKMKLLVSIYNWRISFPKETIYHRPGDKNQLKAQDVTAKLVRFDILRKVPKNNLFCIKLT